MVETSQIFRLTAQEIAEFSPMLRDFEYQFWYPLGESKEFRIEHPSLYTDFFSSMGDAYCFVALREDEVVGVLSAVIRTLVTPNGKSSQVAYVVDVKITKELQGSTLLYRLARTAILWLRPQITSAYSVVMDGTTVTPKQYTGRVGVPQFSWSGRVHLLSFSTATNFPWKSRVSEHPLDLSSAETGIEPRKTSTAVPTWALMNPLLRAQEDPVWLVDEQTDASALLEDTRRAKQLYDRQHTEYRYAHLTYLSYVSPEHIVSLIPHACTRSHSSGFTHLFVTVPETHLAVVQSRLDNIDHNAFSASIYGVSLSEDFPFLVHSSEI
ncbi:MAG: hypothetical protein F4227_05840 [Gammaproteobacteria bacterium]|nr:hypothetical protein [Gammaproteobacteria bacterium]MYF02487.1 hypothetical protein [Gammaproteobacteria bacterium]MYI77937.1 hypothetical protein [Gammaproteobacteria bacterium]